MRTLSIEIRLMDILYRLKGLSMKAVESSGHLRSFLCTSEDGPKTYCTYANVMNTNMDEAYAIKTAKEIYGCLPFDKIKIDGQNRPDLMEQIKS